MAETTVDAPAIAPLPFASNQEIGPIPSVTNPASENVVSPEDFQNSKEILTVAPKEFQEAQSLTHGILINRAKEIASQLPKKKGETIEPEKLPDWTKKIDPEALSPTLNTLSYLQGIRNVQEGVFSTIVDIQAPNESQDMFVMFDTTTNKYEMVLKDGQEAEEGQMKLRITGIKARQGNELTFVTNYDQHDEVKLSVDQFTTLFSYAQRDNLINVFEGKTHDVATEYFKKAGEPEQFQMDRDTMNEAVRNSGRISTEALIQSLPGIDSTTSPVKEEQLAIDIKNKKREQLINKLQNHAIATAQDMAEVMSFHTPDEIQKTINEYKQTINGQLDTLGQLRNQRMIAQEGGDTDQLAKIDAQMKSTQDEINSLRDKINGQTKAEEFFKNPKNLVDFFSMVDAGEISPEMGQQINDLISQGEIPQALMKMAEAKIATLDEDTQKKIREKLGMTKGQEFSLAAVGGISLFLLMIIMSSMKQQ